MFVRNDHVLEGSGGAAALSFGRARAEPVPQSFADRVRDRLSDIDIVPDLGSDIGSRLWWRGVATCAALCAATIALAPGFDRPLYAESADVMTGSDFDEARTQSIAPLAYGANSGRRLAPTALVAPLTDTPERPILETNLTLPSGPSLAAALARAGVGDGEASRIADLIAQRLPLAELKPGTQLELTLGRRPTRDAPRPVEALSFRARFDLSMKVARDAGALMASAIPIAIDNTPLRIQGRVGPSLYRSARAAGIPAKAVESFIRSVAARVPMSRIGADVQYDMIVERKRAATGEVQLGNLTYAGLSGAGLAGDSSKLQLVRFEQDGKDQWFDARGVGAQKSGGAMMPVAGRLTSGFGMRVHPILGTARMHKGLDIAAPMGAPIRAPMDGVVQMAGWAGGYGKFVKLSHGHGLATGFGHMSRIAVAAGGRVSKGQIIGYVGSTGMSTGAHLHYELWKNGVPTNPGRVTFESVQQLSGSALAAFKNRFAKLMAVPAAE